MAAALTEEKQIYLSAEMTSRLAAIDIGSNSVRLLVADASHQAVTPRTDMRLREEPWAMRRFHRY
jgi:hypothetical protein